MGIELRWQFAKHLAACVMNVPHSGLVASFLNTPSFLLAITVATIPTPQQSGDVPISISDVMANLNNIYLWCQGARRTRIETVNLNTSTRITLMANCTSHQEIDRLPSWINFPAHSL
jgi:hypothetical protein